jgi:hypothetical protein
MGQQDGVDAVRVDALLSERDQRRAPEVDRDATLWPVDDDAGLEAPAASERIPGPDEPNPDRRYTAMML